MSKNLSCAEVRRAIEGRDFLGWTGLPADCQAREIFPDLPEELTGRPVRYLGDEFRPATFVLLTVEGYYRPMASFNEDRLVMFDGMNPELSGGFAPLKADLGEPPVRLDWFYGTLPIPNGEWAYTTRGITVFLNTNADKVLHLAVYHPTTPDDYMKAVRPHLRKTPLKKSIP